MDHGRTGSHPGNHDHDRGDAAAVRINCTVGCSVATLGFDELSCTVIPFTNPLAPRSGVMGPPLGAAAERINASNRVPPAGIASAVGDMVIVAVTGTDWAALR